MCPPLRGRRNHGAKSQGVKLPAVRGDRQRQLTGGRPDDPVTVHRNPPALKAEDLDTSGKVRGALAGLFSQTRASDAAAALVPWVCDSLPSPNSRKAYHDDLRAFVSHMADIGVHPFDVTGDHVRLYKEAMVQGRRRPLSPDNSGHRTWKRICEPVTGPWPRRSTGCCS